MANELVVYSEISDGTKGALYLNGILVATKSSSKDYDWLSNAISKLTVHRYRGAVLPDGTYAPTIIEAEANEHRTRIEEAMKIIAQQEAVLKHAKERLDNLLSN